MIEAARPGFLWAGALLAAVPLFLHLLRPRERTRRFLPTFRFIAPEHRNRVHLRWVPDERLLLALRMFLCLLLGAVFAGLAWVGRSSGTGTVVIVDGGEGMAPVWTAARARVSDGLEVAEAGAPGGGSVTSGRLVSLVVVRSGTDGEPHVERFPSGHLPDQAAWARMAPDVGSGEVRLAHLLRALRDEAGVPLGADSLTARIVARPRWSSWGPGVLELREALWPARIALADPGEGAAPSPGAGTVALRTSDALRDPLAEALQALGFHVDEDAPIQFRAGPEDTLGELWDARPPASPPSPEPAGGDAFLLMDGRVVPGAGPPPTGIPATGAAVPLLRVGGRPAAAASLAAGRCELALPLDREAPIVERGDLVVLLEALLVTCLPDAPDGALEAWRGMLEERDGPWALEARSLRRAGAGYSLTRLLLAVTIGLALLEGWRARSVEAGRPANAATKEREPE